MKKYTIDKYNGGNANARQRQRWRKQQQQQNNIMIIIFNIHCASVYIHIRNMMTQHHNINFILTVYYKHTRTNYLFVFTGNEQ